MPPCLPHRAALAPGQLAGRPVACAPFRPLCPATAGIRRTSDAAAALLTGAGPSARRCRPCRRQNATTAASAAAAATAAAEEWVHATGVPLLDAMNKCATMHEAVGLGAQAMGATLVGSLLLRSLLRYLDAQINRPGSLDGASSTGSAAPAAAFSWSRATWVLLSSLLHQGQRLLPLWSVAYVATAASALLQLALERRPEVLSGLLGKPGAAASVLAGIRHVTQFLQDAAEEVVLVLVAFTLLEFKNRLVSQVQAWLLSRPDRTSDSVNVAGLVSAAGALAGAVIWAAAGMVTLANYGVNLRPLLASLGASSLVFGLAAQSMLRNIAAGITLYATRPFSQGDRVVLWSVGAGTVIVEGIVAAVHPTRTVIARELPASSSNGNGSSYGSSAGAPTLPGSTIFVNNGDIVESMIVENRSRAPPAPLATGSGGSAESLALESALLD